MAALLDVNVLVALFDPDHVHHRPAHGWLAEGRAGGWATCPLTENGLVRILSNPSYSGRRTTVEDAIERLTAFRASGDHEFWPDTVSLCEEGLVVFPHVGGHRRLTDVYLLALAVQRGGRLATFDRRIRPEAVAGAEPEHLVLLGGPGPPTSS
jgi:toxin-antitoxin system PIN domain toxin